MEDGKLRWRRLRHQTGQPRRVVAFAENPRPGEEVFAALARGRSPGEVFGVTMLITLYFQLAHIMAALDLETEEPFVGWDAGAK